MRPIAKFLVKGIAMAILYFKFGLHYSLVTSRLLHNKGSVNCCVVLNVSRIGIVDHGSAESAIAGRHSRAS